MATAATVNTKVDEAISAMEGGDWSLATTKLLTARAALMSVPDSEFGGPTATGTKLKQDRNAEIGELINQCRKQKAATASVAVTGGGIQYTKIRHTGVST